MLDDLHIVKDDMTAFIEGHGLKRFHGFVSEEISTVNWEPGDNPDSWKDFVELAKAAGASFLTMSAAVLEKEELDFLIERLRNGWPELRGRLERHLRPFRNARAMLREAGCPSEPEEIGISREDGLAQVEVTPLSVPQPGVAKGADAKTR